MAVVDDADLGAFANAKRAKPTGLVGGATYINHRGLASGLTRGKGTRTSGDTSRDGLDGWQRDRARFS